MQMSGSPFHFSMHCLRVSLPMQEWKSRTIIGYGCGPATDPCGAADENFGA